MSFNMDKFMQLVHKPSESERKARLDMLEAHEWTRLSQLVAIAVLHLLKSKGMTKAELAEMTGILPSQMTRIVKGQENMTLKTICRLQDALGVELIEVAQPWQDERPGAGQARANCMTNQQTFNINISGEAA